MQTEIQFLIDLILNHKLSPDVRTIAVARIGEVEAQLHVARPVHQVGVQQAPRVPTSPTMQCPSTQAILDRDPIIGATQIYLQSGTMDGTSTAATQPPILPPQARIQGGLVDTGRGTKGPRKF